MLYQLLIYSTIVVTSFILPVITLCQETNKQIGEINIEGAKTVTTRKLLAIAGVKPKGDFKPGTTQHIVARIKKAYLERGFIKAAVAVSEETYSRQRSGKKKSVHLKIVINEGSRYYVRRTEVVGNAKTNHNLVMRASGLRPGEPYNPNRIDKWVDGLNRLGRFEPVKRHDIEIDLNEQEHFADIVFHVKEKPGVKIRRH